MKSGKISRILAITLLCAVPCVQAQQGQAPRDGEATAPLPPLVPADSNNNSDGSAPAPAARGLFIGPLDPLPQDSQAQPDTRLLSDSVVMGVGLEAGRRNIFNMSMHASESVDTAVTPGVVNYGTNLGGGLSLDHYWTRYHFIAHDGGVTLFHPSSHNNAAYHNLSASQEIRWSRWRLRLRDDVQSSPQATIGGVDLGGSSSNTQVQVPGISLPAVAPGQTILTGRVNRLQNTVFADLNYRVSPRATLTFSGSHGFLHFFSPGYVDSDNIQGRVGYDYTLSARNSIAVIYGYTQGGFADSARKVETQNIQFAFGRRMTGRLAFQLTGGPQLVRMKNFGPQSGHQWAWSVFSGLTYRVRRTNYSFQYSHAVSAGSGVYQGSDNHSVTGGVSHSFTPYWSAWANGSYSINRNLVPSTGVSNRFDTWAANAGLTRQQGRYVLINFSYAYQQQSNAPGACPVVACVDNGARHVFTVGANWHLQPVRFN